MDQTFKRELEVTNLAKPIPGGFILLARKLLSSDVMEKPPLVLKLWVWMLLQASFKEHGGLKRGQFFTQLKDIQKATAYKVGYRLKKPSIKEIRGSMKVLMKGHMIGTTKVTHGLVITICNYDYYQNPKNYEGHNEGQSKGHTEGTILTRKNKERKKDSSEISSEISVLVQKLFSGDEETYSRMIEAISSTRKTGKLAQGVILSLLHSLEKFPQEKVKAGVQTYLDREYYREGKNEKYLLGIVRNQKAGEAGRPRFQNSGSRLLDNYYKKQAAQGAKA